MRPHRLRVTAFGAFAGTEEVRFDDLDGLFLLHGETGAGKTTLLDAIAFALYGQVPGERGKAKRLRSDHAAPDVATQVELEATVGRRRLRITRSPEWERPKKSGTGMTKVPASVRLEEATGSGGWELKSARVTEADAEILHLMGMSAQQFFQVVLLPQGEFARFLHADAEARRKLLEKLFGTDRFRDVEEWLKARRNATRESVKAATAALDDVISRVSQAGEQPVPDDLAEPVAWARALATSVEGALDEAGRVVVALRERRDAASQVEREAVELSRRQQRRTEALQRQDKLKAEAPALNELRSQLEAAQRAAEVRAVLDEAERAGEAAARAQEAATAARSALPARFETASGEELRTSAAERGTRLGQLEALGEVARQAEADEEVSRSARSRAAGLAVTLAAVNAETHAKRAARPASEHARNAATEAAAELPAAQAAADGSRRVAADMASLLGERATWQRLLEAHLAAREHAVTLKEEAQRLRDIRFANMRFELAALLVDDDECPVCGSLDHPSPCSQLTGERVSREQEEAAAVAADQASAKADEAGQKVAAVERAMSDLRARLAEAGFTALENLPEAELAALVQQAEAAAEKAEAQAASLKAAAGRLGGAQRALDDLDDAISAGDTKQAELAEQRAAALAEARSAGQRAAEAMESLRAQLGEADTLPAAIAETGRLADALTRAAEAVKEADRAQGESDTAGKRVIEAVADAGFGSPAPDDAFRGVTAARAALRDAAWRKSTAEQISQHEAMTEAVAVSLADPELNVLLDPPAPVAERRAETLRAEQVHTAAADAESRLRARAEQLNALLPLLESALAKLRPLQAQAEEESRLADLVGGLGANQYRMTLSAFVLAARLEEVAAAASQRLLTMTAGRYSLAHTDARKGGGKAGLGLLACDSWTGQDRDTSTLSGGETFMASLALALGLADVVTAEAAGTPMEALFVDEGFGTLDEDTLEEVITVLDGLREGGRMVGVVSHVGELRQRIPAQVHIRKGHHGSRVEVAAG